ncbi:MAG TPA: cytochrome b N-terminal domain-containing protein, partial [Planctomycetaceae bacterium]|nr:cytochrome b N-terminal domain-containing protein [Planctomycetaceae bacterium]
MSRFHDWLDHRTGLRGIVHEALYERVPGGPRWRYVWGSSLVFAFVVQLITGFFLWTAYSPNAQGAWESVYYIQHEMQGGWLLRGVHHFMAQAMVVLLALHLLQVVIDGAYKAPREINFWVGLLLMLIVLGLSLTGYLLPWDQKGFWATKVATNIAGTTPVVGPGLQRVIVGGSDYGHHTLTRFFALHAGLLPFLLIALLAVHLYVFRRHGLTPYKPDPKKDATFWPDQLLRDSIACLAVMGVVLFLVYYLSAHLGAPADPYDEYSAARPEWYFLFLFEFLKYFPGETEVIGAIVIPGAVV